MHLQLRQLCLYISVLGVQLSQEVRSFFLCSPLLKRRFVTASLEELPLSSKGYLGGAAGWSFCICFMWASAASNSSTSTELSWRVPEICVGISLVCPKGTQFDEIIKLSQWNPPAQSNAIYLPAFPHLPSWLGTCFEDPGCVFKLNQNVSNPESSTWKSDSICAKASRSLPRASVKRLLSFRSDFNVVSSWDIWTFSAFSVALRENNLVMFFCCYTMIVLDWIP